MKTKSSAKEIKPKKKINSKKKGSAGELEVVDLFKSYGYAARRTAQFCGNSGDASDVVVDDLPEAHLEVKRTETFSVYKVLEQVTRDNTKGKALELILHRRNGEKWVCCMPESTLFTLLKGYLMTRRLWEEME